MKDETHQLENSYETLFLVTNVRSLQKEVKSTFSKTPQVNPNLSSENESSKTKVQKGPQRKSKLKAKTAMSKPEDNFSSENESNATKETLGKDPIKLEPKKYGCPFCSRIMSNVAWMKRHIAIHIGEKPFSCNKCGKAFNQKSSLIQHLKIHTGVKPFSCNFCKYSCIHKSDLKKHVKNVHAKIEM